MKQYLFFLVLCVSSSIFFAADNADVSNLSNKSQKELNDLLITAAYDKKDVKLVRSLLEAKANRNIHDPQASECIIRLPTLELINAVRPYILKNLSPQDEL